MQSGNQAWFLHKIIFPLQFCDKKCCILHVTSLVTCYKQYFEKFHVFLKSCKDKKLTATKIRQSCIQLRDRMKQYNFADNLLIVCRFVSILYRNWIQHNVIFYFEWFYSGIIILLGILSAKLILKCMISWMTLTIEWHFVKSTWINKTFIIIGIEKCSSHQNKICKYFYSANTNKIDFRQKNFQLCKYLHLHSSLSPLILRKVHSLYNYLFFRQLKNI